MDISAVRHLPVAAFTPDLAHRLDLMVPALHVALAEMAARGVDGQAAFQGDAGVPEEARRLPVAAVAIPLERQRDVDREAVVDLEIEMSFGPTPAMLKTCSATLP